MASENETVADIVREMRNDAIAADAWHETYGEMASAASTLNRHADRVEAAHRREVAELRECLKQAYGDKIGTYTMRGNEVERWRKALEGVNDECK